MEKYNEGYKGAIDDLESFIINSLNRNVRIGKKNPYESTLNDIVAWTHVQANNLEEQKEEEPSLDEQALEWVRDVFGEDVHFRVLKGGE